MFKRVAIVIAIVGICLLGTVAVDANQYFPITQISRGWANSDWSFMTAWNLSTGYLQVSSDWYNGGYNWSWDQQGYNRWTALFVYDDGTGQTRELMWSYNAAFIQ